jgi:cell wall-associated NlpC family hydrolase
VLRPSRLALALGIAALAGCATVRPAAEPRPERPEVTLTVAPAGEVEAAGPSESDLPETSGDEPPGSRPAEEEAPTRPDPDLGERLAARARTFLGLRGPFHARGERFNGDCSGFVAAVYAAEGLDLRGAMQRAAPTERRGAWAAWLAAQAQGSTFRADASARPGDLVFWHDTYDRNRNRKADDRFTHVGIVERVEDGTVHFIHRGGHGVARGVMTLARRHEATSADGRRLNSAVRARSHPVKSGGLAAELFAGFGRLDGTPGDLAASRPKVGARRPPAPPAKAPRRKPAAARRT